ncbi:MAG TPA: APC family permease [Fimbriimonadaceae bacterium]|nr:APC family permease [Fimbriimonadaceae bacterium]
MIFRYTRVKSHLPMGLIARLKRSLIGKPIATKHAHHERLPKRFGLAVFASDALSSVAYASEEILVVLVTGGLLAYYKLLPISLALIALLWIVVFSYYQTINAYPMGGGSYRVSSENIGSLAGRVAGSALLIGYVLTVAVSVSAGAAAITSMAPVLQPYGVLIASGAVAIIALLNLRGAKESGIVFAIPTYSFVLFVLAMVGYGLFLAYGQRVAPIPPQLAPPTAELGLWFIVAAFARGCTALTGTEAIADGVQAFRPPEARNAAMTLVLMASLLTLLVLGISWSAQYFGVVPMDFHEQGYRTVVAQIAHRLFAESLPFFAILTVTALILFLAANTGFADFPRLSQFIARDGYLPRQLMSVGDKLVYQNGIITLAVLSIILIVVFSADTHMLIPLYAAGVFLSFTLSQAGMVAKFWRGEQRNWKMAVSAFGAITTAVVTVILLITRFSEGAWILLVALAVMMMIMAGIKRHYNYLSRELTVEPADSVHPVATTALLLVPRLHKGILHAISYAQSTTKDVRALHVTLDKAGAEQIKKDWQSFGIDMPLVILESPYRSLVDPVIDYIDETIAENPDGMVTVIVPQAVPKFWWQGLLHNNAAMPLKMALKSRPNVVITNVRYFLK